MNDAAPVSAISSPPTAPTRDALLEAGRDLFARRGFDGTSIRALTRAAGANLGAVTYHFGSKRALYAAVLERELAPLVSAVGEATASPGTPERRIERVVETYFAHLDDHPDLPRLLLQEIAAGKTPPDVVVASLKSIAGSVSRLVARAQAGGAVRSGNALLLALSVVSQPVYFTLIQPLLRDVMGLDLHDPATRRIAVAHTVGFVRRGLAPDGDSTS